MTTRTHSEESLVAAHNARLAALMANDTTALAGVVGADLRFIGPDGQQITRADVVTAIHAGKLHIDRMDCYDMEIQIVGDIGVLLYSADACTSDGSTTFSGKVRCTTVYAWRTDGWQMINQHQSRLTPPG
jgi:ketosteroid isomerase-like protein